MSKSPINWSTDEVRNCLSTVYRSSFKKEIGEDILKKFEIYDGKYLNVFKKFYYIEIKNSF